jgi:hypothetical protein
MSTWQFALLFVTPMVIGMLVHRWQFRRRLRRRIAEELHARFQEDVRQQVLARLRGEGDKGPAER